MRTSDDLTGLTVLFGAGMSAPAGLPGALDLISTIAGVFVLVAGWGDRVVSHSQPNGTLRFEEAMDWLTESADARLEVLTFLDDVRPGPIHTGLAWAATRPMTEAPPTG
jgi:hypothetical protein